jgi:hypothetical protein
MSGVAHGVRWEIDATATLLSPEVVVKKLFLFGGKKSFSAVGGRGFLRVHLYMLI